MNVRALLAAALAPLRAFLAAGALVLAFRLPAAPPLDATSPWLVRVWQSDDGLPNNDVTGLAQTPDGYLWVATYSRPARFDGVRFEEYSPKELGGDDEQKMAALQLSRDGGLWMGTLHGAVILATPQAVRVFPANGVSKMVQTLIEDGAGALWVSFQGGAVRRIQDGVATTFSADDGLPSAAVPERYVCSLARDAIGQIWWAKDGNVGVFRDNRFLTLLHVRPIVTRLLGARDGGVWICADTHLWRYEEGKTLEDHGAFRPVTETAEPSVLLEDRQGALWIGTAESGLFRYDGTGFASVPTSDTRITSLLEDTSGNLWVGTGRGGLNRVGPRAIALETADTGLPFNIVQSLCENNDGTVWATTQNGLLIRRSPAGWDTVPLDPAHSARRASCVTADGQGKVWIGTRDRSLYAWQQGQLTTYRPEDGLVGREIHTLYSGRNGDLWIGETSPDIVQRLHNGVFTTYKLPPNVRVIRAMAEDTRGNIWVGTSRGVLLRISDKTVSDETARTTGAPLSIRCLHVTPDGALWIGYADEGAGWYKDGRFVHLTGQLGFPENSVSQICADGRGWLWFGGDHGIFRVRQSALETLAKDGTTRPHYIRYGESEGLFSLEANCGDSPGVLRSHDGRLWMPMRTGLARVDPQRLREDTQPPPVLIKRMAVDDMTVAAYGGALPVRAAINLDESPAPLRLPPGHRRLEFDFTALSFNAPENVRFRYRLEGLDEGWTEPTTLRTAGYSRLTSGDYRFRVQACNGEGVWNERGATVAFSVAPFVWQTWWLRLAVLGVFTATVAIVVRLVALLRMRARLRLLQQEAALAKERTRIARDLHDEFSTRLTELGLIAELELQHGPPAHPAAPAQTKLVKNIRALERDLDAIVWSVNPKNDSLDHLVGYLCRFVGEFLGRSSIRCRFDLPDALPPLPLTPEVRHHLFLVVREAVNNVVKHSRATVAKLRVRIEGGRFFFRLEDDGCGFPVAAAEAGERNGLKNMRSRIEELGGVFRVESVAREGSVIEFTVPLPVPPS